MTLRSRLRAMERAHRPGECRCRLEIIHADREAVPTTPPKRCPDCGGEPMRVVITRAEPSKNYAPERWAHT